MGKEGRVAGTFVAESDFMYIFIQQITLIIIVDDEVIQYLANIHTPYASFWLRRVCSNVFPHFSKIVAAQSEPRDLALQSGAKTRSASIFKCPVCLSRLAVCGWACGEEYILPFPCAWITFCGWAVVFLHCLKVKLLSSRVEIIPFSQEAATNRRLSRNPNATVRFEHYGEWRFVLAALWYTVLQLLKLIFFS